MANFVGALAFVALVWAAGVVGTGSAARITSAGAKVAVIVAGILAFVASGYEHVVANMTFYWLGVFLGDANASVELFASNMLWVGLGNLIGGGLIVGLGTWALSGRPTRQMVSEPLNAPMSR